MICKILNFLFGSNVREPNISITCKLLRKYLDQNYIKYKDTDSLSECIKKVKFVIYPSMTWGEFHQELIKNTLQDDELKIFKNGFDPIEKKSILTKLEDLYRTISLAEFDSKDIYFCISYDDSYELRRMYKNYDVDTIYYKNIIIVELDHIKEPKKIILNKK